MVHLQALASKAHFIKEPFGILHPLHGPQISLQEMAVSDLSPANQHPIGPGLKGLEDVDRVDPARTGEFDHTYIMGILQPHGSSHIRCRVGAVRTDHCHYFRIKVFHYPQMATSLAKI